jgi:hypothetical protein
VGLLIYTFVLFGGALFSSSDLVAAGWDVRYFATSRAFGFGEMREGNLALWNPYLFSGAPFLANFTSALLYPPNAIYFVLPLAKALNAEIALHTWLLGVFLYAWVRSRGMHPVAAFFAGVLMMSSGAFFPHIRAGHLSMIASWAWTPLIFLAAEKICGERENSASRFDCVRKTGTDTSASAEADFACVSPCFPRLRHLSPENRDRHVSVCYGGLRLRQSLFSWTLVGVFGVTMQILAGHPQCVYFTALMLGVFCVLRLPAAPRKLASMGALSVVAIAPVFLSAAQLWPGLAVAGECTRAGGKELAYAASLSLPPENIMRLVVPDFFGSAFGEGHRWWGRSFDHESSVFIGMTGLVLAMVGAVYGARNGRWLALAMVAIPALLALGEYTPVYKIALAVVPGLDLFRVPARFTFFATLFIALLAGAGLDRLLRCPDAKELKRLAVASLAVVALFAAMGLWIARRATVDLKTLAAAVAIGVMLCAFLWKAARKTRWAAAGVVALGLLELGVCATGNREPLRLSSLDEPELASFVAQHPGDYRILDSPDWTNRLMRHRVQGLWGSDPVMLRRYCELVKAIGGPDSFEPETEFPQLNRSLANVLRCRYVMEGEEDAPQFVEIGEPYPRFYFVRDYRVLPEDQTLAALTDPGFDPRTTVLLEREPNPRPSLSQAPQAQAVTPDLYRRLPAGSSPTKVTLLDNSTDHMTLDVTLSEPAILVNTDAYSKGLRAIPVVPGPQARYEVLAADHALRAIPLAAGKHTIRVEYAPAAFRVGMWVSVVAWAVFGTAVAGWVLRRGKDNLRRASGIRLSPPLSR